MICLSGIGTPVNARGKMAAAMTLSVCCAFLTPLVGVGQTFPVEDVSLRIEDQGEGIPIVFIPGWTQSLETWDDQVVALRDGYRVLRFDRGPWGLQSDPVDLLALLEEAEVDRAVLVAHSAGVPAALRFATNFPDRVLALVLGGPPSAPGLGPWNDEESWGKHLERLGVEPPNPFVIASEEGVDSLLALAASHPLFRIPEGRDDVREKLRLIWERYDGSDLTFQASESITEGFEESDLTELGVPTLIVVGEDELAHFRGAAERLHYLLPDSQLKVVEGGGHMVHLINPGKFNSAILDFLERRVVGRDPVRGF